MSEKVFKPVADAFALIHAGGEPYQWATNAVEAVAWLNENPKYSVKEYVSLDRYQAAVSDEIAALQQKLDAVLAENTRILQDYRDIPEMRRIGAPLTPATDAILNVVRAEGVEMFADKITKTISDEGKPASHHAYAYIAMNFADKLRAETDTTSSQYESLAGGK